MRRYREGRPPRHSSTHCVRMLLRRGQERPARNTSKSVRIAGIVGPVVVQLRQRRALRLYQFTHGHVRCCWIRRIYPCCVPPTTKIVEHRGRFDPSIFGRKCGIMRTSQLDPAGHQQRSCRTSRYPHPYPQLRSWKCCCTCTFRLWRSPGQHCAGVIHLKCPMTSRKENKGTFPSLTSWRAAALPPSGCRVASCR